MAHEFEHKRWEKMPAPSIDHLRWEKNSMASMESEESSGYRVPTLSHPSQSSLADAPVYRRRFSKESADQKRIEAKGKGKGKGYFNSDVDPNAMNIRNFKTMISFVNSQQMQNFPGGAEERPKNPLLRCPSLQSLASDVAEEENEKKNMSPIDQATVDLLAHVRNKRDRRKWFTDPGVSEKARVRSGSCDLINPSIVHDQLSGKLDNLNRRHSMNPFIEVRSPNSGGSPNRRSSNAWETQSSVTTVSKKSDTKSLDTRSLCSEASPGSPTDSDSSKAYPKRRMTYSERRQSLRLDPSSCGSPYSSRPGSKEIGSDPSRPGSKESPSGSFSGSNSSPSGSHSPKKSGAPQVTKERMALSYQERRQLKLDQERINNYDI